VPGGRNTVPPPAPGGGLDRFVDTGAVEIFSVPDRAVIADEKTVLPDSAANIGWEAKRNADAQRRLKGMSQGMG
jgi:hypothetical protein